MNLSKRVIINEIKRALAEDVGRGDITTLLSVPKEKMVKANIVAKEGGVICGIDLAGLVFKAMDKNIRFTPFVLDGASVNRGKALATIYGLAAKILAAERVALNFLSMLSGIATKTRFFVNQVKPYKVKILDTRKTLPGLRALEKYAVSKGGGCNHRFKLDEMLLIKDNHLKAARRKGERAPIKEVIRKLQMNKPKNMKIEAEVKTLSEFKQAIDMKPDIIMLDNMDIKQIRRAVKIRDSLGMPNRYNRLPQLEVSGNITMYNVKRYASCGIDFISVGSLTKDVKSLDISLDIL